LNQQLQPERKKDDDSLGRFRFYLKVNLNLQHIVIASTARTAKLGFCSLEIHLMRHRLLLKVATLIDSAPEPIPA
jgi:hypothetical protein